MWALYSSMREIKRRVLRSVYPRVFTVVACCLAYPESALAQQIAPEKRPNVLFIVVDDMNDSSAPITAGFYFE